jgi:very-short-patch-repair endonuclease
MKTIEDFIEQYAEQTADDARVQFNSLFERFSVACESPIEQAALAPLLSIAMFVNLMAPGSFSVYAGEPIEYIDNLAEGRACLILQCAVDKYRVDFLLAKRPKGGPRLTVAIECDGHDFHEKTKEQAARDKARDRALLVRGVQVMRFTGSEIWKNPSVISDAVIQLITAHQREKKASNGENTQRPSQAAD